VDLDSSRLTFVVAGGGFTGIEMLGEMANGLPLLCKEYGVPFEKVRIIGVEATASLLPFFGEKAIGYTPQVLEDYGVEIMTSTKILECTPTHITLGDGRKLPTHTLIWSCGVRGNRLLEEAGFPLERTKLPVNKDLLVKNCTNIFCIGDSALFMKNEKNPLPPTAQVALQQAPVSAENIVACIRGEQLKTFEYQHKGSVASIGDRAAIGKIGSFSISGLFGSCMKQVIEIRYLFVLGGIPLVYKQTLGLKPSGKKVAVKN
jgi:NADH:ubiquinone reductase (H+-translocating)